MNNVLALQELSEEVVKGDEVTPMSWWVTITTTAILWSTASNQCPKF